MWSDIRRTREMLRRERPALQRTVGDAQLAPFDEVAACVFHPQADGPLGRCPLLRKPRTGMLAWPASLMVGDSSEDRQCADRAGLNFGRAGDFFDRL